MIIKIYKKKPNGYKINPILTPEYILWRQKYNKLLDTAISTWSGYVYQGKVAIYHVLRQIGNRSYELQLDSIDDFSILDENKNVISMHQVKALKSQNFSTYKKAFEQLQDGGNVINCSNLYFHVARSISDKTVTSIENNFVPVKVYKYDTTPYCEVNQIDDKIESLIIGLMQTYHKDDLSKETPEYVVKVRRYLDDLVVKKLFEIHRIIHLNLQTETEAAYQQTIDFSEFIDILGEDLNQVELGDDYYLYLLKADMLRYYQGYCLDYTNELDTNDLRKLNAIMLKFEQLDKNDIVRFIQNIMPHRIFKFNTIKDYKDNTLFKEEVQGAFLKIIQDINNIPNMTDKMLIQWTVGNDIYSPTTIDKGTSKTEEICKKIVSNALDTDLNVLFESNSLITTDIEVDAIASPNIIENIDIDDEEVEQRSHHIMMWREVSLVTLETAKEKINV